MRARVGFRDGVRDASPLLVGVVPFALAFGVVVAESSIDKFVGWLSSPLIFGGAAQLVMVDLFDQRAAPLLVIVTGLVINARHIMYSASLAPAFQAFPRKWRLLAPYVLTDQAFALSDTKYRDESDPLYRRFYFAGVGALLVVVWNAATAIGVVAGAGLPEEWSLEFAVPLMFIALLAPAVRSRPGVLAALVGAAVAYLASALPLNLGLMVGAFAGIAAGYWAESSTESGSGRS